MQDVKKKRSNLVMPMHYQELTREEMEYVDGGWSLRGLMSWIGEVAVAGAVLGATAGSTIPLAGTTDGTLIGAGIGMLGGAVIGGGAYGLFGGWVV